MALLQLAITTILILGVAATLAAIRLQTILDPTRPKPPRNSSHNSPQPAHLLIVLGSGGHTAEMIAMLERAVNEKDPTRRLNLNRYQYRTYLYGKGDTLSDTRARVFEAHMGPMDSYAISRGAEFLTVPRAREIHQSVFTAPVSCLRCMIACGKVLLPRGQGRDFPDLILCNGPATATVLVFTALLLRFLDVRGCHSRGKMRTIYVESWARVKRLSLSGRLLERIVDRFLVQWPQLEEGGGGGRREFLGVLV